MIKHIAATFFIAEKESKNLENEKILSNETDIACNEGATIPDSASIVSKTIGKTTYVASLHFKEQGQTFSQKLKRVLKADAGC